MRSWISRVFLTIFYKDEASMKIKYLQLEVVAQPALHMRPTRVPNGFLYGAFVGALYGPQSVFANGFLMGPIWFINKGHIWAPYGAFIVK